MLLGSWFVNSRGIYSLALLDRSTDLIVLYRQQPKAIPSTLYYLMLGLKMMHGKGTSSV